MTLIKRYSNRKLYDVAAARYVTLDELGERIRNGEEFSVIDHDSGADMTALTLIQIMFEREKHAGGMLPRAILTGLIQAGNVAVGTVRSGISALVENTPAIEAEIRRRIAVLVEDGQVAVEEAQRYTDLLVNRWKRDAASQPAEPGATQTPAPPAPPAQSDGAMAYPLAEPVEPPIPVAPILEPVAPPAPPAPPEPGEVERLRRQIEDLEQQIAEIRSRRS